MPPRTSSFQRSTQLTTGTRAKCMATWEGGPQLFLPWHNLIPCALQRVLASVHDRVIECDWIQPGFEPDSHTFARCPNAVRTRSQRSLNMGGGRSNMESNLIQAKLNKFWIQPDPMHFLQRLLAFVRSRLIEGNWIQPGSEPDPHVLPQIGD